MGFIRFLAGSLFCASCWTRHVSATDSSTTYQLPTGGSLHVEVTRQQGPAGIPSASSTGHFSGASMSFAGPSGSLGAFPVTTSVEMQGNEPPIIPEQAKGGVGYFSSSYERSGSFSGAEAPRPKSQILYGWVPDVTEGATLHTQNMEELNNALRSRAFVTKLWSKPFSCLAIRCEAKLGLLHASRRVPGPH